MLRSRLIHHIQQATPPFLWNALAKARGRILPSDGEHQISSGVRTKSPADAIYTGRFNDAYERHYKLDPHIAKDGTRYRVYNVATIAAACRNVPGDFVCCGVSFGIAPRVVFDFVDFPSLNKTLHLVDPFEGVAAGETTMDFYNRDAERVRSQYPSNASIVMHRAAIPKALPLPGVGCIAFAFNNTGDAAADAASLPILWSSLSEGGAIITDQFAYGYANYKKFIAEYRIEPLWLASGQGVFFKR